MERNKINLNKKYYILQNKNNNVCFTYLKDFENDKTICESANIYTFIEKAKNITRISKNIQEQCINFAR